MAIHIKAAEWAQKGRRSVSTRTHAVLPAAALLCVVALRVADFSWCRWAQSRAFDALQVLKPRVWTDAGVRIIDLDDESLAKLGQWPWPRTQVGALARRLHDFGAAAVAFDIFFSEPDRTSPSRVTKAWPDDAEFAALKKRVSALPDHDALLAKAIKGRPVVLGFAMATERNDAIPALKTAYGYAGEGPLNFVPGFPGAVVNLPVLEAAAAGLGSVTLLPELDQVVRRVPLLFRRESTLLPSLSLEALRVAQGAGTIAIKMAGGSGESAAGGRTGLVALKVGAMKIPVDETGGMWVYYTRSAPGRTIPAWKLFEKGFDGTELQGAICFVGTSAAGLKDLRVTPLNPVAAGVEVHANVTEQIITQEFLNRPDWAAGAEIVYMTVMGLLLLALLLRAGAVWSGPAVTAAVAGTLWLTWHSFTAWHWLLDALFPTVALLSVYATWSAVSFVKTEAEKRNVTEAFGKSLHPKLVAELSKHPERLALGGETREITILFCDIRGFTTISEQYDAQGLTHVINRFLTPMSRIIMDRFGYIDKYIGDCIMAFWNAPSDDAEHARNACAAVLQMRESLKDLNKKWREEAEADGRKHVPVNIGLGLNTGDCCVGYMGSDQKLNYTCLGDDVNLSSRLEGQSKAYHVDIVIGPRTRELAPDYAALELDLIKVKGKTKPVRIFTLVGGPETAKSEGFRRLEKVHEEVLGAYRRQDWDAVDRLAPEAERLGEPYRIAGLYDLYVERAAAFRAEPPGADWDGVFVATSK